MFKISCATIALIALVNPALAAGCATAKDAAALKTAAMQQELMVAAFQCREASAYNGFVTLYRSELQSSDMALKSFFVRRSGDETGYDSFKTKAANLSALEQARHSDAFCADAHALFAAVLAHRGSLASFVDSLTAGSNIGGICVEPSSAPQLARADVRASNAAQADAAIWTHREDTPPPSWRSYSEPPRYGRYSRDGR